MSVGMGIYVAGATVGSATAIACGQFVDLHAAFIVLAVLLGICTVIWALLCKSHPDGEGEFASQYLNTWVLCAKARVFG